jgi:Tfp pilus assembly protein PilV
MRTRQREDGFTMIEVLIAVLLTVIAVIGIIALFMTETRAAAYSRRATEATNLATDKLEKLRTLQTATSGSEATVDVQGDTSTGMFEREWTVTVGTSYTDITVIVAWDDDNVESVSCTPAASAVPVATCLSQYCRSTSVCASRAVVVRGRRNN